MKTKIFLFGAILGVFGVLIGFCNSVYAQIWQKTDMGFTSQDQTEIAIGDGRGDGVMRVYAVTNEIHEYSYVTDHWVKDSFGDDFLVNTGITIADAQHNGVMRVYVTKYSVHEYGYTGSVWQGGEIYGTSIIDNGILHGTGRNDGVIRLYTCDRDGIKELSFENNMWSMTEINNTAYANLILLDGQNGGMNNLYATVDDHVFEYSWDQNAWLVDDCGEAEVYNGFDAICGGNGRNDGKNRIYLSSTSSAKILELSYDGQNWQYQTVATSVSARDMELHEGRNDGIIRLYAACTDGVKEYTYSGSWSKTADIDSTLDAKGIAVGKGRNGQLNYVYATGSDNHIYEYCYDIPPALSAVQITGTKNLLFGNSTSYTCTASFNDGTYTDITNAATWSENCQHGSILNGFFSTTAGMDNESCTITASYQNKNDTLDILLMNIGDMPLCDVNTDGVVGLEETIYTLQVIAGLVE